MVAPKVSIQRTHTGSFVGDEAQRQARLATVKTNAHVDAIAVLNNRAYVALATDFSQASTATYATLLTATITTLLDRGYLIITFSASGQQITNASIDVFMIVVDGVQAKGCYQSTVLGGVFSVGLTVRVPVRRGKHTVLLQTKVNNNSLTINAKTVAEEHAHLLVQEAA